MKFQCVFVNKRTNKIINKDFRDRGSRFVIGFYRMTRSQLDHRAL